MSREIKISAICKTPELFSSKRIVELEVDRTFRIVCAISVGNFKLMHHILRYANRTGKKMHHFPPLLECFLPVIWLHEILDLHLRELAQTENEIARSNFVSKCLSYLRNTKR